MALSFLCFYYYRIPYLMTIFIHPTVVSSIHPHSLLVALFNTICPFVIRLSATWHTRLPLVVLVSYLACLE